jgi:hypothetical protein
VTNHLDRRLADFHETVDALVASSRLTPDLYRRVRSPGGHHDGWPAGGGGCHGGDVADPTLAAVLGMDGRAERDPVAEAWRAVVLELPAIRGGALRLRNAIEAVPGLGRLCAGCGTPLGGGRTVEGMHSACYQRRRRGA